MQVKLKYNKGATLETNEIIEIVLSAGAIILLLILFLSILNFGYDKNEETMKSYFNTLKGQMDIASKGVGSAGEFEIWQQEKDVHFYVIYFGSKRSFNMEINGKQEVGLLSFFPSNTICVCMFKDELKCPEKYCLDLHTYAKSSNSQGEQWVLKQSEKAFIREVNDEYVFDLK